MSKKFTKNYVFVVSLCYNLLLLKLFVSDVFVLGVAALNEQQYQEVQHLKDELSEALENDKSGKTPIIQPLWTQKADKSVKIESAKVEVNAKNLHETAVLRAEIEQAVSKDTYAKIGTEKLQNSKPLEATLNAKGTGNADLLSMAISQQKPTAAQEEFVGSSSVSPEDQEENFKAPNVITANIDDDSEIDIRKLQRLEVSKRRTREVLVLKYIEEDVSFEFGADVNEWQHIGQGAHEYLIGRRVTDLLIVRKESTNYERAMIMDIGHIINYMASYTYWNWEQQQQEGVILIAAEDKLLWYRVNTEAKQVELYWHWLLGNTITSLTYFTVDSKDYLTIGSMHSYLIGHNPLSIYEFQLAGKEFWIVQHLQLEFPCSEVTILNSGRDVILAVAQNNTAAIYTFNPHEAAFSHIHFELKKSVAAEGILTIAGFKMGGHSYLALTGYKPQILLYEQGDFISRTILGNNFGLVELFFPIPVRTYRDDLILLVQHRVDFSTHSLTVVETLIWDGEAFETSIPVTCHLDKHVVYGVGCMLDLQRNEGLRGAALLKSGDNISVLVPRYKVQSGLFGFHTELLAKNSQLLDLQEIFDFLKSWVQEQDDLIAQAEMFLQIPNEELIKRQKDLTVIESLNVSELEFHGDVEEIYVNDYKWTLEDSNIDLELLINAVEDLEKSLNLGRQRRNLDDNLYDELSFDEVVVEDLELENLNGQPFFIQNGKLDFAGLLSLSNLETFQKRKDLPKRQLNDEALFEGDLEFEQINGVNWSEIEDNLVFLNETLNLEELEITGTMYVEDVLTINTLNELNFPNDFLLSNGPANSTVTGEKHFIKSLTAGSVDTNGDINGKNPADALTLTETQHCHGMTTFKQLEVEELHCSMNPTLQEDRLILSTCHFNELIVNGPIIVLGEIDNQSLGSNLKDIEIKPKNRDVLILIPSLKVFDSISFSTELEIEDGAINKIPIANFVTVNTKQTLNIPSLEGSVFFHNLTVNGSYDGVKIEDILQQVIRLDKPLDLSTTELIFPDVLQANSITILDTLNSKCIKNKLQTLQEDLIVNTAQFSSLRTTQADFSHDIMGQGKLNNINLHAFVNKRSCHYPPIKGNIYLNELILERGIQSNELHGIRAEFLMDFLEHIDELPQMILNGKIQVDSMTVTGSIKLNEINDMLFEEEILLTTINLHSSNFLSTSLHFKGRLDIKGHLNLLEDLGGINLPNFMEDIVMRPTNSCLNIKAHKHFLQPVEVLQNTQVKALNGILMENVTRKSQQNIFKGSVHLKGNLMVREIHLQGTVNNFNWQHLQSLLYFNETLQNFVLRNSIQFVTPLFLDELTVLGNINDVENLQDLFKNLIYKNQMCVLTGNNTFTGRMSIEKGAYIQNLNGHNLTELFNNLVFIHGAQTSIVIETPVTFEDSIRAGEMVVRQNLSVETLNGCSVSEWLNNSLRVNQDHYISSSLKFAAGSLDGNLLSVNSLNGIDLAKVITLNTPQTFNETVNIPNVFLNGNIRVLSKGLVNNVDLKKEFNNTLMTYGQQYMHTPLTIKSIIVLGDLDVRCQVNNNINLNDVATLQEDLILESPLYFKSIYSPQVMARDLTSGIDFDKWFKSAVKYESETSQYITGHWTTKNLTIRTAPTDLQYMTNGLNPWQHYSRMRLVRSDNETLYEEKIICQLLKDIWRDIDRKPVFVKYVEEDFDINFNSQWENSNETFTKVFSLTSSREQFLLINIKMKSVIYKWLTNENKFIFENSFRSGFIDEIHVLPECGNNTKLEFVTSWRDQGNCSLKFVYNWKLENGSIVLIDELPKATDLIYKVHGNVSSLWSLHNETIQELDLYYNIKNEWQLPFEQNKTCYRFVPLREEQEILLTNGEQLMLLSKILANKSENSSLDDTDEQQSFQNFYYESAKGSYSQSLLGPNIALTHLFTSGDLKQLMKRILIGLGVRLNQQVIMTQLTIPETDLLDEHLVPDFLATIDQLASQTVLPADIFNIDNIMLPQKPFQVLAARLVQLSWPVAIEIEKIHSYLRSNESHDHPLCLYITKSLALLIKDVLMLANVDNAAQNTTDSSLQLNKVIERVRSFDKDLQNFVKVLEMEAHKDIEHVNAKFEQEQYTMFDKNRNLRVFSLNQNNDVLLVENSHLPGYKQGEILCLWVGSSLQPRRLWAVTNRKTSLAGGNNPGIYLYLEGLKGALYQVISAIQPRSLQQLRIKQETLLLFVEHCCLVQLMKYRGSQGFISFAEINSKEFIKQILTITVPSNKGNFKYFLLLLLEKKIKFYELVLEGYDNVAASAVNPLQIYCS